MTAPPVNHDTIVLERTYDAPPARVFAAFASPEARMRWGAPSPSAGLVYDKADFRVGGVDLSRCGPRGHLIYSVETRYLDIVPQRRIISTEVVSEGANLLCFALITVEFAPAGDGTRLILTDQVAAFGGRSMIEGHRAGHTAALGNLVAELQRQPADACGTHDRSKHWKIRYSD
jgi:uncharacterized protein YndB with AHSA1/START domain